MTANPRRYTPYLGLLEAMNPDIPLTFPEMLLALSESTERTLEVITCLQYYDPDALFEELEYCDKTGSALPNSTSEYPENPEANMAYSERVQNRQPQRSSPLYSISSIGSYEMLEETWAADQVQIMYPVSQELSHEISQRLRERSMRHMRRPSTREIPQSEPSPQQARSSFTSEVLTPWSIEDDDFGKLAEHPMIIALDSVIDFCGLRRFFTY